MDSEKYLQRLVPLRDYYESGRLKSETYLVHMVYIIYRFSESGEKIGLTINGIEYSPDTVLVFDEANGQLNIKT